MWAQSATGILSVSVCRIMNVLPMLVSALTSSSSRARKVITKVTSELTSRLADTFLDPLNLKFGRCGGMAFGASDLYLQGWNVSSFGDVAHQEDELGEYIYDRLLESIEDKYGRHIRRFPKSTTICAGSGGIE